MAASHVRPGELVEIAVAVAENVLDLGEELGVGLAAMEERDGVAGLLGEFNGVAAEELGAAEDEKLHRLIPLSVDKRRQRSVADERTAQTMAWV